MKPTIEQLIQWSHEAGQLLREGFGRQHQVQMKGSTDLVTEMGLVKHHFASGVKAQAGVEF